MTTPDDRKRAERERVKLVNECKALLREFQTTIDHLRGQVHALLDILEDPNHKWPDR